MKTRTLPKSIVRGLFALSLASVVACEGNHAGSPLQPTIPSPAEDRNGSVTVAGETALDSQARLNQEHLPAVRAEGEQLTGTGATEAPLSLPLPSLHVQGASGLLRADYIWDITTANVADAGTDANMYFYVTGSAGSTNWMLLDNPNRNDFERGQTDHFSDLPPLKNLFYVDQPTSFTVYNDQSGGDKWGWALGSLRLTIKATDGTVQTRTFYTGSVNWIDRDHCCTRTFPF